MTDWHDDGHLPAPAGRFVDCPECDRGYVGDDHGTRCCRCGGDGELWQWDPR